MTDTSIKERFMEDEKIKKKIKKGDLDLEQAISEFEKGIKLSKECSEKLDDAEKRINILVKNENGEMTEEEFEQE